MIFSFDNGLDFLHQFITQEFKLSIDKPKQRQKHAMNLDITLQYSCYIMRLGSG